MIETNFKLFSDQLNNLCGQKKNYFWTVKKLSLNTLDRQKPTFIQPIRTNIQRRLLTQIKTKRVVWVLRHNSLGAQRQKNDYNLAKGLRIKYGKGGYETQEKPRLSTGGRGVQA